MLYVGNIYLYFPLNEHPGLMLSMDWRRYVDQTNVENTSKVIWLVVSTHLKNISQNGNLLQVGVKIKNIRNHHPVIFFFDGKLSTDK